MSDIVEEIRSEFQKGQEALQDDDFGKVKEHALRCLELIQQANGEGHELLADANMLAGLGTFQEGNHEAAIPYFDAMIASFADDPDEMLRAANAFAVDYGEVGKVDAVLHWFDKVAAVFTAKKPPHSCLAVDAYTGKYMARDSQADEQGLQYLDQAYQAALADPMGFVISNRAQQLNAEYIKVGQAARALPFVDQAIAELTQAYQEGRPVPDADEDNPNDGFLGDRVRYNSYVAAMRESGSTPRPIVTLHMERALLLLEIDGKDAEALESTTIVAKAIEAEESKKNTSGGFLKGLLGRVGLKVSVTAMGDAVAADIYMPDFYYAHGESLRRQGNTAEAKRLLNLAQKHADPDEDATLTDRIQKALAAL